MGHVIKIVLFEALVFNSDQTTGLPPKYVPHVKVEVKGLVLPGELCHVLVGWASCPSHLIDALEAHPTGIADWKPPLYDLPF